MGQGLPESKKEKGENSIKDEDGKSEKKNGEDSEAADQALVNLMKSNNTDGKLEGEEDKKKGDGNKESEDKAKPSDDKSTGSQGTDYSDSSDYDSASQLSNKERDKKLKSKPASKNKKIIKEKSKTGGEGEDYGDGGSEQTTTARNSGKSIKGNGTDSTTAKAGGINVTMDGTKKAVANSTIGPSSSSSKENAERGKFIETHIHEYVAVV